MDCSARLVPLLRIWGRLVGPYRFDSSPSDARLALVAEQRLILVSHSFDGLN